MKIEVQPKKIMRDGATMSVRVGFLFDEKLMSIRISDEYIEDKFHKLFVSSEQWEELVRQDLASIEEIVIRKAAAGIAPLEIIVMSKDI